MAKKVNHIDKGKIYTPRSVFSTGATNIITDNLTKPNGCIENCSADNAAFARTWVNENKK